MGQCGNYIHHTDYNSLHWCSFTTNAITYTYKISYSNTIKIYIFDIVFFMIRDILPKYVIICKYMYVMRADKTALSHLSFYRDIIIEVKSSNMTHSNINILLVRLLL